MSYLNSIYNNLKSQTAPYKNGLNKHIEYKIIFNIKIIKIFNIIFHNKIIKFYYFYRYSRIEHMIFIIIIYKFIYKSNYKFIYKYINNF